jgi:2-polyprenyl-6-methoxyphenol hydroxylase-like FAD-dependent oxidoreductase
MTEDRVFIAGAGPVGLVAAARLVAQGVPVTVFETRDDLSKESRASTFHPSTLDMLDELGAVAPIQAQGLRAPRLQYRCSREGLIARFDFGDISDLTRHPYRLQCEQWRLTRALLDQLTSEPSFEIVFATEVCDCSQSEDSVTVTLETRSGTNERSARWLIGADGASSNVRSSLNIEFEGFTWPERFLVLSTPFDFYQAIPDLDPVSYVADPEQWYFALKIPELWRMMFPIGAELTDDAALDPKYGQSRLNRVVPRIGFFDIVHQTLYRVHQRVAKTFHKGRIFLAGDAAHINNPLGGMGMNGGIHDAQNLTDLLIDVWNGEADTALLERYDIQRRGVTMESVQVQTVQNKRDLEATDEAAQAEFRERLRRTSSNREKTRSFLKRVSMLTSLERAAELS